MKSILVPVLAIIAASGLAQDKVTSQADAEKTRRSAALRATLPRQEAEYLALVKKARAELELAKKQYESTRDVQAYQTAIHRHNWAITSNTALGEIVKTLTALRDLHREYDESGKFKRPFSEACTKAGLEGYHWIDRHVWANLAEPVAPVGVVDRSFLSKKKIKLVMGGDSITDYMDPGVTMLDYLDGRFEVLGHGLSGHTIHSWFTSNKTQAVREWQPDVIVLMLGTNATAAAMQDDTTTRGNREHAKAKFTEDLLTLRNLPGKPQVVLVAVPAAGPGLWYHAGPAMWEMQSQIAREQRLPFVDLTRSMQGLMSDLPNGFAHSPNRKSVGRWSHAFDDAHCSSGCAMAKYYGLVCRQILELERWYNLNLQCSATTSADWKEPWLIAQCYREPVSSGDRAQGVQATAGEKGYIFGPHANRIKRGTANGEVSFLRPGTGGDFYLMPGRTYTLTFGRPYQLLSDTPSPEAAQSFPATYAVSGTLLRGDGRPASGVKVTLASRSITTDKAGRFAFEDLSGNIVEAPLVLKP